MLVMLIQLYDAHARATDLSCLNLDSVINALYLVGDP